MQIDTRFVALAYYCFQVLITFILWSVKATFVYDGEVDDSSVDESGNDISMSGVEIVNSDSDSSVDIQA